MLRKHINILLLTVCTLLGSVLGACSDKDPADLLNLVPNDVMAVMSVYPEQPFKAADIDRKSDSFRKGLEAALDKMPLRLGKEQKRMLVDFTTGKAGISFAQWVLTVEDPNEINILFPVEDRDAFIKYIRGVKNYKEAEAFDHLCWLDNSTSDAIVYDSDLRVAMLCRADGAAEAAKAYDNLLKRAKEKPLADWQRKLLDGNNRQIGGLFNLNASGLNFESLQHSRYGRLFGSGVEYIAMSANGTKEQARLTLTSLDGQGNPANLFNPDLTHDTDFEAANMLPDDISSAFAIGVNGANFADMIPTAGPNNELLHSIVDNARSIALGSDNLSQINSPDDLLNTHVAIVAKFAAGSNAAAEIQKVLNSTLTPTAQPDGSTMYEMPGQDLKLYTRIEGDNLLLSTYPAKFGTAERFKAPSDALTALWMVKSQNGIKDINGAATPGGVEYTINIGDINELIKYYKEQFKALGATDGNY